MGDLNYRMNTKYSKFNNSNIKQAFTLFKKLDQLTLSMQIDKNFPGYEEAPITFLPTYKLSKSERLYIDKKDQAPSYCDRVLYKNNSSLEIEVLGYEALHEVYGSDHRPILLTLAIKNFKRPRYYELSELLKDK
mmetsp:Transcript_28682/g.38244  ORF Transcript_28682/g.38244 Transcript_28682/m.38244 type:complete len:134 (+) Transcript_28682:645-1046(+)